jgi:hypothetical protein
VSQVTSKDGTSIAYERLGRGAAVVLVGGAIADRSEHAPLAAELAGRFTVVNYDRRGRGGSGDTLPYAVEREIEDIEALIAEAGGSAHLFGASSGGGLALQAAAAGVAIDRLAVYEVPWGWPSPTDARRFEALLAEGRRGDTVAHFMRTAGASEEEIAGARKLPVWPGLEAIAHTIAYDAACMGNGAPPSARLATITRPTLVATANHAWTPPRAGCRPTSSTRPRPRSPRASRKRNARPSQARDTWSTRRRSLRCSAASSAHDDRCTRRGRHQPRPSERLKPR